MTKQERGKAIAADHQTQTDTLERFHQAVIDGGLDADHTAWIAAVAEWHGRGVKMRQYKRSRASAKRSGVNAQLAAIK